MMWREMGWLCGTGFGWTLFMVLFWAVGIVGLGFLVWWLVRLDQKPRDTAVESLRERYAQGEVSRQEFEERRRALGG